MTAPITAIKLPSRNATEHFLDVFRTGGLRDQAEARSCLSEGSFYAVAPEGSDVIRLEQFGQGGLLPTEPLEQVDGYLAQPVLTTVEEVARITARKTASLNAPVLWIHESLLNEAQIAEDERKRPYQKIDGQLYLVYDGDFQHEAWLKEAIGFSLLSWHFLAFVTDGIKQANLTKNLLESAQFVIVGAYDGESVVVWERDSDRVEALLANSLQDSVS